MSRILVVIAALVVALLAPREGAALTVQEALLVAKPAVALVTATVGAEVTMDCGQGLVTVTPAPFVETGTGWFVDGRGYLVTNAHVVDPTYRMPPWVTHELKKKAIDQACVDPALKARGIMRGQSPDVEERIRRVASDRGLATAKLKALPKLDVLLSNGTWLSAEVKKFSPPLTVDAGGIPIPDRSGRDLALLRVKDGVYPVMPIATREPKLGDPVHILGFPGVVNSHELLNQSARLEASVTNGAVSGLKQDAIGQDVVQTDAAAAHGNSGGPAVGDDGRVLGVLTFVSLSAQGAIVQGYNFLVPAADVRKFLEGTDASPGRDAGFNSAWIAGLDALFKERYSTAAARLKETNKLLPDLPDVKRALAEAEFKVKNPPPRPFPWVWVAVGVTVVSCGAYGGMLGQRWWKNRFRILPTQVINLIEHGKNPVLLDVRSKSDYDTSPLKLPGSVRLAPEDVDAGRIDLTVEPSETIVTYDTTPGEATSARVTQLLRQRGFRNVRILKGGIGGWTNARLPIEAKSYLPSIGLEIYKNLTLGDVEKRHFPAGQTIFREGEDPHGEAYVVHAGTVEIRQQTNGTSRTLTTLAEGELFGEMALFRKTIRSAEAVATSEVDLLVIKIERLEWLIRNRPQLTLEVLKRLSDMVDKANRETAAAVK